MLIKPVSALCNLGCDYCFYLEHLNKASFFADKMDDTVLTAMTRSFLNQPLKEFYFNWQGGEPLLAGVNFYKKALELQKKYAPPGANIRNTIQTNGTLMNSHYAELFAEHDFLVGVSLDGPPVFHNYYRKTEAGEPTHKAVMTGLALLQKNEVEFNILCLVSSRNVRHPQTMYHYFRQNNFHYLQFIPCIEYDDNCAAKLWSISGKQWGAFLNKLFEVWYKKDTRKVSIRNFDDVINKLVLNLYSSCSMKKDCRNYLCIESNGNVYPCDFFVDDDLCLGTITKSAIRELSESIRFAGFGYLKSELSSVCPACKWLDFCNGDCLKHRIPQSLVQKHCLDLCFRQQTGLEQPAEGPLSGPRQHEDGAFKMPLSKLCEGISGFYEKKMPQFVKLAQEVKMMHH